MSSQLQKTFDIIVSPSEHAFKGSRLLEQQPLKVVLENYLKYYGSGDTHTARAKRYDLNHFLSFLSEGKRSPEEVLLSDWTAQSTKDFIDSRLQSGEAPATVSRRLATLKHLGRTLAERFHGYINPAREIKGPVLHITAPHGLDSEEIRLLTTAAAEYVKEKEFSFVAQRNAFLLELLLATGLRADEVRLLTMGQISENLDWLKNVKTKGRKYRNVYLDRDIRERLGGYLELRAAEFLKRLAGSDGPRFPLLISFYGISTQDPSSFGLSPKTIWRTIAHFGKLAQGLAEKDIGSLHPHRLRHTFAHGLLESSRDVRLVAQALGHSDVRTTMRYTERTDEEVARAIEEKKAVEEKQLRRR